MFDAILGLGFGGTRLAKTISKKFNSKFYSFNTSKIDYAGISSEEDLFFDANTTTGNILLLNIEGTGKNPSITRKVIKDNIGIVDEFCNTIANSSKSLLICAGLGGGTGSGSIIYFALTLIRKKIRNVGLIITIPFLEEGMLVSMNALKTLNVLHNNLIVKDLFGPVFIVDNNYGLRKLQTTDFNLLNKKIAEDLYAIYNLATGYNGEYIFQNHSQSLGTLDYADLLDVLYSKRGYADIRTIYIPKESIDDFKFIKQQLANSSDFCGLFDIRTAQRMILNISIPERYYDDKVLFEKCANLAVTIKNILKIPYVHISSLYTKTSLTNIRIKMILSGLQLPKSIDVLMNRTNNDINVYNLKRNIKEFNISEDILSFKK